MFKIARHIPSIDQKVYEGNMRFAELDIPKALASYAPPLVSLSQLSFSPTRIKLTGRRRTWRSQLQRALLSSLTWFPSFMNTPWMPADNDHVAARTRWRGFSKQAKRSLSPQELTTQAFTLYPIRFLFSADLCQAWTSFGGNWPKACASLNRTPFGNHGIRRYRPSLSPFGGGKD